MLGKGQITKFPQHQAEGQREAGSAERSGCPDSQEHKGEAMSAAWAPAPAPHADPNPAGPGPISTSHLSEHLCLLWTPLYTKKLTHSARA